jgi:hypothetical protein
LRFLVPLCAQLLGSLLDDVLKSEVGTELFNKVERIRSLAQCAAQLANKHDSVRHTKLPTFGGVTAQPVWGCLQQLEVKQQPSGSRGTIGWGSGHYCRVCLLQQQKQPAVGRRWSVVTPLLVVCARAGCFPAAVSAHG